MMFYLILRDAVNFSPLRLTDVSEEEKVVVLKELQSLHRFMANYSKKSYQLTFFRTQG